MKKKGLDVHVVFGEKAVRDMDDNDVSTDVVAGHRKATFATEAEAEAFLTGIATAIGWGDYVIPSTDQLARIRRKARRSAKQ